MTKEYLFTESEMYAIRDALCNKHRKASGLMPLQENRTTPYWCDSDCDAFTTCPLYSPDDRIWAESEGGKHE